MLLRVAPTATHTKKTNKSAYGRNCTQKAVIQRGVAPAILPLADFFSRRRSTDILITKSRMAHGFRGVCDQNEIPNWGLTLIFYIFSIGIGISYLYISI